MASVGDQNAKYETFVGVLVFKMQEPGSIRSHSVYVWELVACVFWAKNGHEFTSNVIQFTDMLICDPYLSSRLQLPFDRHISIINYSISKTGPKRISIN